MCTFTNPRTRNCRSPSLLLIHAWQNSTTLPRLTTTCPISAALYVQVGSNNSRPRRRCCSNAGILVLMVELALERHVFAQRGKRLEYFTIAWNSLEGIVAVVAGTFAGSISLVGFGIDSFIEVTSGSALLWRMSVDAEVQRRELNERRALRIVGVCFLLLAAYLAYESVLDLWSRRAPEHSIPGIVLACVSLVVMPLLSRAKR